MAKCPLGTSQPQIAASRVSEKWTCDSLVGVSEASQSRAGSRARRRRGAVVEEAGGVGGVRHLLLFEHATARATMERFG